MTTSNITRARILAGADFIDMPDSEVLSTLAYSEKIMSRELEASESIFFQSALSARRTYLDKKAGVAQPKFEAAMYGNPRMTNTQDQPEGYLGE